MTDRLGEVTHALQAQVSDGIAIAVTDPRMAQPALLPAEQTAVATAIPKRQAEFAAGRAAARAAMAQLGGAPLPILKGADRAPVWPEGWQGSISHKDTLCAAGATRLPLTFGIDIEEATPLKEELIPTICDETELSGVPPMARSLTAKRIFSAKEAAYKAQYPQSQKLFGFDHMRIAFDGDSFTATFAKPAHPFGIGDVLQGRQITVAGHLVSVVTIGQAAPEGA